MSQRDGIVQAADGTRIVYTVAGVGPALVLTNGLTTTSMFWRYLRPHWLAKHTVLTWELPGHGGSEPARSAASATIQGQPDILARVMDAAGLERATQVGFSVGCQVVLELACQLPERCAALVTLFGAYRNALSSTRLPLSGPWLARALERHGAGPAVLLQQLSLLARLPGGGTLLRRLGIVGEGTSERDVRALIQQLRRVDPATGARLACSAEVHSAEAMLGSLRMPLLIVTGGRDLFAPPDVVAEPLHRAVAHSQLVCLPDASHTALLDHHEQVAQAVDAFLASLDEDRVADGV